MPSINLNELRDQYEEQGAAGAGEPLPDGSTRTKRIKVKMIEGDEAVSSRGNKYIRIEVVYTDVERNATATKTAALFDREQAETILSMEPGKEYDVDMEKRDGYWKWLSAEAVA